MLLDYAEKELTKKERLVCVNEDWIALVPYWATWPFETMLIPKVQIMKEISNLPKRIDTFAHKVPGLNPGQDKLFVNYLEGRFYFTLSPSANVFFLLLMQLKQI